MAFASLENLLFCSLLHEQGEPHESIALPALVWCPRRQNVNARAETMWGLRNLGDRLCRRLQIGLQGDTWKLECAADTDPPTASRLSLNAGGLEAFATQQEALPTAN